MPPARTRAKRSVEYSILYTATLCLLAAGAVMVYSASSAESLLQGSGDPSFYLKRYVMFGLVGLVVLHLLSRHGLRAVRDLTPVLLVAAFVLTAAVMLPGDRRDDQRRHPLAGRRAAAVPALGAAEAGADPLRGSPAGRAAGDRAAASRAWRGRCCWCWGRPALLLLKQPDMGTAMVICFAMGALLVAAGTPMRYLGALGRRPGRRGRGRRDRGALPDARASRPSSTPSPTPATRASRPCRRSPPSAPAGCSGSAWASRSRRSSTCPRPTRT